MSYLTATGQIRVLEKKLLDETDMERMVDAKDAEEAFKVFSDTDLADNVGDAGPEDYGKILDQDMRQTKAFLEKAVSDKNLLRLLFLEYDFHNIKVLLKSKYFEKELYGDLSGVGTLKTDELKKYILKETKKLKSLTSHWSLVTGGDDAEVLEIIDEVIEEFDVNKNDSINPLSPSDIDLVMDKKYFEMSLGLAKKIGNDFIWDYIRRKIDLVNLRALIRVKNLARDKNYLKGLMTAGGKIDASKLTEYTDEDLDKLIEFLHGYLLGEQEKFLKDYANKKFLWQLEKGFDDLDMNYVKQTKWLTAGPEIVFGYWYAKMNALRNVRLIMTGKLNNIPADEIKQRVRLIF